MTLTEAHQKKRQNRITGTKIAKIVGLSKWGGPIDVWRSMVEPEKVEKLDNDSIDLMRGQELEDGVARMYARITGREIKKATFRVHPEHKFIAATPDYYSKEKENDSFDRVVEIKCPRYADDWGEPGTDEIPVQYIPQVAFEMACSNVDCCDVVALIYGDIKIYHIVRDRDLEQTLVNAALKFHEKYIKTKTPPPIDSSEGYQEYFQQKYDIHNDEILEAKEATVEWAYKLKQAKKELSEAKEKEQEAKNHLQSIIGENKGLVHETFKITWSTCKGRKKINWQAIATELDAPKDMIDKNTTDGKSYRMFRAKFK